MRKGIAVIIVIMLLLGITGIAFALVSGTSNVPACPRGHANDGFGCGRQDSRYCYYQCKHLGCDYSWDGYYPVAHCYLDGVCMYCGMSNPDTD